METKITRIIKTAVDALKMLWEEGFFRSQRKSGGIAEELSEKGYNFPLPTLGMALGAAKYLTRDGKRGEYRYIQKYPYSVAIKVSKSSKKNKRYERSRVTN